MGGKKGEPRGRINYKDFPFSITLDRDAVYAKQSPYFFRKRKETALYTNH